MKIVKSALIGVKLSLGFAAVEFDPVLVNNLKLENTNK